MQSSLATRENAIAIGKDMKGRLPILSGRYRGTKSKTGNPAYTRAVWIYFNKLRKEYEPAWTLYPKRPGKGKAKGEFLIDFALFDEHLGWRIACESEWGREEKIGWAFDKLMHVKADLKILVFQMKYDDELQLPRELKKRFVDVALALCGHHHQGHECYILIQFSRNNSRIFFWEPTNSGRQLNKIEFEYIP